jgi:hypothetical protein
MKNFIIFILLLTIVDLHAQVYLDDCAEAPMSYNTQVRIYKPAPCNVIGTKEPTAVLQVAYPAIQVGSFSQFPKLLPDYVTRFNSKDQQWKVYVDFRIYNQIDAEHQAQEDGYCQYTKTNIISNPFPGLYQ